MGLIEDLGRGTIAIDSAVFIYYIEEHPQYFPLVEPVFAAIDRGRLTAVTSTLTLLETLVIPYRAGHLALVEAYEDLLSNSRNLRLIEVDLSLLRIAALLRATLKCRTPDALQMASALSAECTAFLTNDQRLRGPESMRIFQLATYLPA